MDVVAQCDGVCIGDSSFWQTTYRQRTGQCTDQVQSSIATLLETLVYFFSKSIDHWSPLFGFSQDKPVIFADSPIVGDRFCSMKEKIFDRIMWFRRISLIVWLGLLFLLIKPDPVISWPADESTPDSLAYLVVDDEFTEPLSEVEHQERLATNLPVPAIVPVLPSNSASQELSAQRRPRTHSQMTPSEGWSILYSNDFEAEFQEGLNDCKLQILTNDRDYAWGRSQLDIGGRVGVWGLWPAAGGDLALDPTTSTYPEELITQIVCYFPELDGGVDNIMVQFDIWQDAADTDDRLFVGLHSGEFGTSGETLFYGLEWTQTHLNSTTSDHGSETRRNFFPDSATRIEVQGGFSIMWQFTSDATRHPNARGVWLDNVQVERYLKPESSRDCQLLDPGSILVDAPGEGMISKGINLPPYLEDDLGGRIERLSASDVHWVRLEFAVQPDDLIAGYQDGELILRTLDLKYFDELIDAICAKNIAVLGLIDYASLPRQDWQNVQRLDEDYIRAFQAITQRLVAYFDDRIGVWEIWNEPDYTATRLLPAAYVDLLVAAHDTVKNVDPEDKVVFGSLGSADPNAGNYLREVAFSFEF